MIDLTKVYTIMDEQGEEAVREHLAQFSKSELIDAALILGGNLNSLFDAMSRQLEAAHVNL